MYIMYDVHILQFTILRCAVIQCALYSVHRIRDDYRDDYSDIILALLCNR